MRCILYARVSLEEQAEMFGLASQIRALREYAAAKGYTVVAELADEGYTGADLDRPALIKIRELVRGRQVDVVVAYDLDRLSRARRGQFMLMYEFERAEVRLEFVNTSITDTPEGRMLMDLKGMFAEFERDMIRERTLRGRREKAKQGFIVGGRVPFGYKYLGKAEGERGRLVIDENQAATVRQIFDWASSGQSIRGIAARLNEEGVLPALCRKWGKSSIANILKNETYIGQAHYNRRKRCRSKDAAPEKRDKYTSLKERPVIEWINITTPAIISRPLFDRVATMLDRNKAECSGRPTRRYLLRGLVWCGKCQNKMAGDPGHGSPCYRCCGREKSVGKESLHTGRCQQRTLGRKLDTTVWQAVVDGFSDPKRLNGFISKHRDALVSPSGKVDRKRTEQEIERLKARESRAVSALLDSTLGEHHQQIRRELVSMTSRRRVLEQKLSEQDHKPLTDMGEVADVCRSVQSAIQNLSEDGRQAFLRLIIEAITVTGLDVVIRCALPSSMMAQNRPQRENDRDSIERLPFTLRAELAA